jgi:phosphate-selective porin OprO/OprP
MTARATSGGIRRKPPPPAARRRGLLCLAIGVAASCSLGGLARGEEVPPPGVVIDSTATAGDADAVEPRHRLVRWNQVDGKFTTMRFGFGFLLDFAAYEQDDESEQQVEVRSDIGLRDFRLLARGELKTGRPISWMIGYMYDGADDEWRFRQTGVQVDVPEIRSRVFVGRTKEGYSLIKVMTGYHGWLNERSQSNDAFVPILADGAKLLTYLEKPRVHLNLGYYRDDLTENEKFATADNQAVARLVWQPILSQEEKSLLHLGVMGRSFHPDEGTIQVRARPGSYLAPYFLDTGRFAADDGRGLGAEAFYRKGPWLFGVEYNHETVHAVAPASDPSFWGGDVVIAWNITGETRPYNAPGAYFTMVSPTHSVFEDGPGAWEAVLHFGYSDFDDGDFEGGRYWRLTPMVNWHMSDNVRLEFIYGYGTLDRFDLRGGTQFLQARIQTTL